MSQQTLRLRQFLRNVDGRYLSILLIAAMLLSAFLFLRQKGAWCELWSFLRSHWAYGVFFLWAAVLLDTALIGRDVIADPLQNVFDHFWFSESDQSWNGQIIANICVFVPYTFFWLLAERRAHPVSSALLLSFGTSLFFELSQLIFSLGSFQFSDLMWNVVGGAMGYLLWLGCVGIKRLIRVMTKH